MSFLLDQKETQKFTVYYKNGTNKTFSVLDKALENIANISHIDIPRYENAGYGDKGMYSKFYYKIVPTEIKDQSLKNKLISLNSKFGLSPESKTVFWYSGYSWFRSEKYLKTRNPNDYSSKDYFIAEEELTQFENRNKDILTADFKNALKTLTLTPEKIDLIKLINSVSNVCTTKELINN